MVNRLTPKNGRTAKTKRMAAEATQDQIALTLQHLAADTKRRGVCDAPAWLVYRLGLGEHQTSLGKFKFGMFGRSLARFKVRKLKN